jgi:ABC-type multidrug transport system ATPase subunit
MTISLDSKKSIYRILIQTNTPFIDDNYNGYSSTNFEFLKNIWNLSGMPSEDSRYSDAEGDIYQHIINNNDWDIDYLFEQRLKLYEDDKNFIKFLETVISPIYRSTDMEIIGLVVQINDILDKDRLQLSIYEYAENGLPIYRVFAKEDVENIPLEIKKNTIVFLVQRYSEDITHLTNKYNSYFLLRERRWDDYTNKTSFYLYYMSEKGTISFGIVKIMVKGEPITIDVISKEFYMLPPEYCSLGQGDNYYFELRTLFPNSFKDVLFALGDSALFPSKLEEFENLGGFKNSLIRGDEAERTLRLIKYKLEERDLSQLFTFSYKFKPKYSNDEISIGFNFNNDKILADRIYAIIGKNGTGKTQLLTSLPTNISENNSEHFHPFVPMFSKMITVSYSIFDKFDIPRKTSSFNYVYCGLKDEKGNILDEKKLVARFHKTWKKIEGLERINKWRTILANFIEPEVLDEFLVKRETITSYHNQHEVSITGFNKVKDYLSSGQNILLYIITEITANIRFDSLLLYDEPETHLHPNAISQLINTIYELVEEFQSFCIIGTHSPLIVQELISKNVYVMEREGNIPLVRRIGIESFGENLTTLTEDVFGNKEIPKQYKRIIDEQIEYGKNFEDIVSMIQYDDVPLSLNAKLYIKSRLQK